MKLDEIRPVVYSITPRKYFSDHRTLIHAHRNELILVREGTGEIRFGSKRAVAIAPGSVVVLPPDSSFAIRTQDDAVSGLSVSFDYMSGAEEAGALQFEDAPCLDKPLVIDRVDGVQDDLMSMLRMYLRKEPFWQLWLNGVMQRTLVRVVQYAEGSLHELIDKVIDLVTRRYAEPLNNADIAAELGYHPNYVNAVFVRSMGMSLHQYLIRFRVEMAAHLLLTTTLPISMVADRVGFRHFSHFSNCFHRLTGLTPAAYRVER